MAVLLILLVPFDWFVALLLLYVSKQYPSILSLRERAVAALICAIVATLAGILGWARLGVFDIPNGLALGFIAIGLILVSIPALYWSFLLVRGKWRVR